jgi:hypothetical protein
MSYREGDEAGPIVIRGNREEGKEAGKGPIEMMVRGLPPHHEMDVKKMRDVSFGHIQLKTHATHNVSMFRNIDSKGVGQLLYTSALPMRKLIKKIQSWRACDYMRSGWHKALLEHDERGDVIFVAMFFWGHHNNTEGSGSCTMDILVRYASTGEVRVWGHDA